MKFFLNGGRLTGLGVLFAVSLGAGLAYVSLSFLPTKFWKLLGLSIGLGIMGSGAYSARASALGLPPPFTNDPLGWREAKKSYQADSEAPKENSSNKNDL
jgi:hypothetical protein